MANTVRIDIEVAERGAKASTVGQSISRSFTDAAGQIDRVFDKTSKSVGTQLDKIEREAWESGRGTNQAFDTALAGLRRSLELTREEGAATGQGLKSSLGDSLKVIKQGAAQLADSLKPVAQATIPINQAFDKTARLVGVELDRIERDAWLAGKGTDAAFQTALKSVRDDFERVRDAGRRTGATLESEMGQALRDVRQEMDRLGTEAKQTEAEVESSFADMGNSGRDALSGIAEAMSGMGGAGGIFGEMLDGLSSGKTALIGAGAAVGAFIVQGIQMEMAEDKVGAMLAAQTGATSAKAEALGDTAGRVFANNFGESIEQVGEAMGAVFENKLIDTDASQQAIQGVTEKLIVLSQVSGEEFGAMARAARQMVVTGLAGSVDEAMDMIAQAQEKGLNASQDLLDTLTEYGTSFRQLGLDGPEALGLINQAMEGGARNSDIAADALKEFSIRAQDMSDTTRRGFQTLGLDAEAMGRRIAGGGEGAKVALREVLNRLNEMPPSVERSTAAVDLFGAQAEDMAGALRAMDLDTAAADFGEFGGSVEDMARKIEDSVTIWDKLGKGISNLAGETGDFLEGLKGDFEWSDIFRTDEFEAAKQVFEATGDRSVLDELKEKYPIAAAAVDEYLEANEREKGSNKGKISSTEEVIETLDQLIAKQQEAAGIVIGLAESEMNYQESIDAAQESLDKYGKTLDINTEAGRANKGTLLDIADAALTQAENMSISGATTEEVTGHVKAARDEFVAMAQKMGMSAVEANMLANKLGLIPGSYVAKVRVDAGGVEGLLSRIRGSLSSIGGAIASINWGGVKWRQHGGITGGLDVWGAASGGQRHGGTMINEAGPELVRLPDGSNVATAGATRALAEAGAFSGGGGATQVVLSLANTSELGRAILNSLRVDIRNEHGGDVLAALGQGAA